MKKNPIREIVKDPKWQKVRESLIGKWANDPEWCCQQLRQFLGNLSSTSEDNLRIVMNYLTGTGFRTGRIKHQCIQKIRDDISNELRTRKLAR